MLPRDLQQVQSIQDKLDKNAEYWEKRFKRLERRSHMTAEDYINELDKQYKLASISIKDKLAGFYAQFADSEDISLAAAKKLLTDDQLAEFHMSVEEYIKLGSGPNNMDPDVQKMLERASIKYRVTRLEAIETELAAELEQLRLKNQDITYSAVSNAYRERYYRTIFEIQKGIGVGSTFSKVDEKKLAKILEVGWVADGRNFSSRIWQNKTNLYDEMTKSLSQALILGQGYANTSEQFMKRMGVSFNSASRLIITESAYYTSVAQQDSFKELNVDYYEIVATLDHVTSEICRYMDGQIFRMADFKAGVTAPPFHVNCRTTTCPYFDDSDLEGYTEGQRAARNDAEGQTYYVPAGLDYDEWYRIYVLGGPNTVLGNLANYRKKHQNNITRMIEQAPGLPRRVYNKCSDIIKVQNPNYRGDKAFYQPPGGRKPEGVLLNMAEVAKGDTIHTPYQTKFHEDGHNIDHILNTMLGSGDMSRGYSETFKDGLFGKTVEREAEEHIRQYGIDHKLFVISEEEAREKAIQEAKDMLKWEMISESEYEDQVARSFKSYRSEVDMEKATKEFCQHIKEKIPDLRDRSDLSDMFEVYTYQHDIYYPFGAGHGILEFDDGTRVPYFEWHDHGVEAFAEIFSAMMANRGSLKQIIEYFPDTYSLMLEMLGEA